METFSKNVVFYINNSPSSWFWRVWFWFYPLIFIPKNIFCTVKVSNYFSFSVRAFESVREVVWGMIDVGKSAWKVMTIMASKTRKDLKRPWRTSFIKCSDTEWLTNLSKVQKWQSDGKPWFISFLITESQQRLQCGWPQREVICPLEVSRLSGPSRFLQSDHVLGTLRPRTWKYGAQVDWTL